MDTTELQKPRAVSAPDPPSALPWPTSPSAQSNLFLGTLALKLPRSLWKATTQDEGPGDFRGPALRVLGRRPELLFLELLQLPKVNA